MAKYLASYRSNAQPILHRKPENVHNAPPVAMFSPVARSLSRDAARYEVPYSQLDSREHPRARSTRGLSDSRTVIQEDPADGDLVRADMILLRF